MSTYLLLDFGTSTTKSALVDVNTGVFRQRRRYPALPSLPRPPGHFEISAYLVRQRFIDICTDYWHQERYLGIIMATEMHGFVVIDRDSRPVSEYVGWKDERSLQSVEGRDTFSLVCERLGDRFKSIVGMHPRPGFPLMNLIHLLRLDSLPLDARILSLPSWLCRAGGAATGRGHATMLMAMALYDLETGVPATELGNLVSELTGYNFKLDEIAGENDVGGYLSLPSAKIPIYVGVGDHQCAVLGAGNLPNETVSINLGTGSQVARIDANVADATVEIRPYFGSSRLATVTHIPAGRVLSDFILFLEEVADASGGTPNFWNRLADFSEEEVLDATLDFGLSTFQSARAYRGGGHIKGIREGSFTLDNYLASLLKGLASQYPEVVHLVDPQQGARRCVVSGGIAQRLPVLTQLLSRLTNYPTTAATPVDEVFLGLRSLALIVSGHAPDYLHAQSIFGRQCDVLDDNT